MKAKIRSFIFLTVPSLIISLIILELVFRFVIPASQIPYNCFYSETLMLKKCSDQVSGMATFGKFAQQRGKWRINNDGWNSPVDYQKTKSGKERIAVIGDSYVEALHVDMDKSYPSLLRENVGHEYEVFSFGVAAIPLSQYLHMSRYVVKNYDPDTIIFNVVHNDFHDSLVALNLSSQMLRVDVRDGVVSEVPPSQIRSSPQFVYKKELARKGARLKYLVAEKSALMRYLVHNLKIMNLIRELFAMRTIKYEDNVEVGVFNSHMGSIRLATEYILGQIRNENKDKRIIFIMDAPRRNIYKNTLDKSKTFKLHELMRTLCANNGFELIDLTEPMREDFEKNRREFQSEHDWHWNEEGHRVAYEQVLRLLRVKGP